MIKIMVATDLSERSDRALRRARRLARQFGASLELIYDAPAMDLAFSHTIPQGVQQQYLVEKHKETSERLADFLASLNQNTVKSMVRYEETDMADEILNAAHEEQADLLVRSTRGSRGAARLSIGSVTNYVLGTSSIDVLAMPPLRSEQTTER